MDTYVPIHTWWVKYSRVLLKNLLLALRYVHNVGRPPRLKSHFTYDVTFASLSTDLSWPEDRGRTKASYAAQDTSKVLTESRRQRVNDVKCNSTCKIFKIEDMPRSSPEIKWHGWHKIPSHLPPTTNNYVQFVNGYLVQHVHLFPRPFLSSFTLMIPKLFNLQQIRHILL